MGIWYSNKRSQQFYITEQHCGYKCWLKPIAAISVSKECKLLKDFLVSVHERTVFKKLIPDSFSQVS